MRQGMKMFEMAVDLLILLSIISAGLSIKSAVEPILSVVQQQSERKAIALAETQFSAYDSHIVSGSTLTTAVDRYSNLPAFYVYVQLTTPAIRNFGIVEDGSGTSCPSFDYTSGQMSYSSTIACNTLPSHLIDPSNPSYILPQARFFSTLVRDNSRRIIGIYFQQR